MSILENLERENIKIASFNRRAWAYFIDEIIVSVFIMVIYSGQIGTLGDDLMKMVEFLSNLMLQIMLLKFIYHAFFVWYFGASPGKMLLKMVCIDAFLLSKPTLKAAVIRSFIRLLSEFCFYLGFLWAFSTPLRQTWQDKIANTLVCDV